MAGLQRSPCARSQGPLTRYPYAWPGPTPGTNAYQMSASLSFSGICVSVPFWSNRHKVTPSAMLEAMAKFVPTLPKRSTGIAPSWKGEPGRVPAALASGLAKASGATRAQGIWTVVVAGWSSSTLRCYSPYNVSD